MPPPPAAWPARLAEGLGTRAGRRGIVALFAGLALYALLGFLVLPAWLLRELPAAIDARLGTRTQLDAIAINPFGLTLEARGIAIATGDGSPLFAAERLFVDVAGTGLLRAALVLPELRLSGVVLDLARESDGRIALQTILSALDPPEPAEESPTELPRLLLEQLAVEIREIRLADRAGPRPARIALGPLRIDGESLSTQEGRQGRLRLEATLPGDARLSAEAGLSLQPLEASGTFALEELRPAIAWDFLRDRVALEPPEGLLSLSFDWSLEGALAEAGLALRALAFSAQGLSLKRPGMAEPLLALRRLSLDQGELDLAGRRLALGEIRLEEGAFSAALDAGGRLDWESLLPADPAAAAAVPADAEPWQFTLSRLGIAGLSLAFRDATRRAPLQVSGRLGELQLAARGRTTPEGLDLAVEGATLEFDGILGRSEGREEPLARIARLRLEDARLDLLPRRLQAQRLAIEGLEGALTREADGSLREIALVSTRDPADPLPISQAAATWSLALAEFAATGLGIRIADASTSPPIAYAVTDGRLTLSGLDTATPAPVAIDAVLPLAPGGRLRLAGTAAGDASLAALQLGVEGLALSPLAPLVAHSTTLALADGRLSAELALDWRDAGEGAPALAARGTLAIDDLLLNESASGERLLAWRAARASGVDFASQPGRLAVRELRLVEPGARIIVQADRRTNLSQLLRSDDASDTASGTGAAPAGDAATGAALAPGPENVPAPPLAEAAAAAEPFPIRIERLRVDGGTVDFADYSLVLPFAVRIEQLKGVARGISSAGNARATLKFDGRVGEHGEAEIDGQLAPFDPRQATDIEVAFRNIAVNSLSPYSAHFAGRAIQSGDLDLGLQYKVDGGRLAGDNQLLLRDLRLGERVKSPDATNLPLDLAIALLTDSRGRIDIALPVSGNVDDPRFSYGRIVWKAIGNLIAGLATAPFRALGGLFGGAKAEEMQAVHFASGSAELRPRERERLATLAEALAARPRLGVGVSPGVEKGRDGHALRRLSVRRAHAEVLGHELDPGEDPGPVSYADGHSQRALEKLLEQRDGEEANARFAAQWSKRSGREPDRVNAALAFLGADSEDTEYYRALYLHLVRSTPEPTAELAALAKTRSEAVIAELARRGVEPARLESGKPAAIGKAQPSGVLMPITLLPRAGR